MVELNEERQDFAWPPLLLATLVIILGALASLRQPLGPWLPWVALTSIIVSAVCWRSIVAAWKAWLLAAATVYCVMLDASGSWAVWRTVSSNPDAWSYGAFGDYLRFHPAGTSEGMSLLHQWASHLQNTRFASSALIALTGYIAGTDALLQAHALFTAVVLATMFFSTASLGRALGRSTNESLALAVCATGFGWSANALIVANYDNVLFVALLPMAIALLVKLTQGSISFRDFLFQFPLVTAALFYAYPEGLALTGVLASPLVLFLLRKIWGNLRSFYLLAASATIMGLLIVPYAPVFWTFLQTQLGSSTTAESRPGVGYFPGLLSSNGLSGFWALGTEYSPHPLHLAALAVGLLFFTMVGLGAWKEARTHPWFWWIAIVFAVVLGFQIWANYDYGTYKVIYCAQWWLFAALTSGAKLLLCRFRRRWQRLAAVGSCSGLVIGSDLGLRTFRGWHPQPVIESAAQLPEIRPLIGKSPVLLHISNPTAQLWSLAFLRDYPLVLENPVGYLDMPHVRHLLARGKPVSAEIPWFTLRDGVYPGSIWCNGDFSLLSPMKVSALIQEVKNPNGIETVDGLPFIWIGSTAPTRFTVKAFSTGNYDLRGARLLFGPSSVPGNSHTIELTDARGTRIIALRAGDLNIPVKLDAGLNEVSIRSTAEVSSSPSANGDPRELMLGLGGYFFKSTSPLP